MRRAAWIIAVCVAVPAAAQENDDLALIPGAVQTAAAPTAEIADGGKYALSNAFGWYSYRGSFAVPMGSDIPSRWNDRLSFDALKTWTLSNVVTLTASDVLSASFADGIGFPRQSVRNDLRELYVTWDVAPETYLEAGRINVRNGVAYGYNPTDFFRARTSVAQSTSDPSALRNNRLGTFMVRAQKVFDGGSVQVMVAPKLHSPVPMGSLAYPLDPKFDQTNDTDRVLVSYSFELEEFSPQLLAFYDGGRFKFGLNASHPIGATIIGYFSWAGGNQPSVIVDAFDFGKRVRTLPSNVPVLPFVSDSRSFQNDVSAGLAWSGENKESVTLEYNFHQAGFSKQDWRGWFAAGANPAYASLMWYIRGYSGDRQQPISQHQAFLRADWSEPFHILHFDINGYVMTDLLDGSCTGQFGAWYDLSDQWSVGGYVSATTGGKRTDWGSMRGASSAILQLVRYL